MTELVVKGSQQSAYRAIARQPIVHNVKMSSPLLCFSDWRVFPSRPRWAQVHISSGSELNSVDDEGG
ncbi:MAG: hypothetical protein B7Z55_09285 [Planctomycetales bacterium 12-60-4]|nr:MAG: hypothetical protein B7Z55_09285 [Planctomycetales bacterium 12-60-4]